MAKLTFSINGKNANATRLDVKARSFSVVVDEPADLGGTDAGPNPVEYVLAGADTSADDATLAKWLETVEGRCPVSDNLSHATPISVGVNDLPPIVKH